VACKILHDLVLAKHFTSVSPPSLIFLSINWRYAVRADTFTIIS
jgi:hypothetical protein